MDQAEPLILGEFTRRLDERYRLSIPPELLGGLDAGEGACVLAKERKGCLSVWKAARWEAELSQSIDLIRDKVRAGKLAARRGEVQLLGRLLSTRHAEVRLTPRGRLLIPAGFREFLAVGPGDSAHVVGAALCVEIWQQDAWLAYLEQRMPRFHRLLDRLSG